MGDVMIVQHGDRERHAGDPGLTPLGHDQATMTGRWLRDRARPVMLRASPLRRAVETATAIASVTGLAVGLDERLRERMNWDDPARLSLEQFMTEWARATADRDYVPAVGDSSHVAAGRLLDLLDGLARRPAAGATVLVSHGGVTVDLLRSLVDDHSLDRAAPRAIEDGMPSCGLTWLRRGDAGWVPTSIGETGHLNAD